MFSFLPIGPLLGTRYDVLEKIRAIKHRYCSCTAIATKSCPSTKASWFSLRHRYRRNLSRSLARATTIPIWSAATGILNN